MRIAIGLLTVTLLVFGAHTLARGDDGGGEGGDDATTAAEMAAAIKRLEAQVASLEMEAAFQRGREEALTKYIIQNKARSDSFAATAARARDEGFEMRKTPTPSRITLLRGLEAVFASAGKDLPYRTKDDEALLKKIAVHRKLNQLDD